MASKVVASKAVVPKVAEVPKVVAKVEEEAPEVVIDFEFLQPGDKGTIPSKTVGTKGSALSGYNCFYKYVNAELKKNPLYKVKGMAIAHAITRTIAQAWAELDPKTKAQWNALIPRIPKAKGTTKVSGWNLYVSAQTKGKKGISMVDVASAWKAMSKEDKLKWNTLALDKNKAVSEAKMVKAEEVEEEAEEEDEEMVDPMPAKKAKKAPIVVPHPAPKPVAVTVPAESAPKVSSPWNNIVSAFKGVEGAVSQASKYLKTLTPEQKAEWANGAPTGWKLPAGCVMSQKGKVVSSKVPVNVEDCNL